MPGAIIYLLQVYKRKNLNINKVTYKKKDTYIIKTKL